MPLDPKLQKFTTASPTLLSVSFTDALIGAVYKTFYGMEVVKDTATKDYILFPEILNSNTILLNSAVTNASFVKLIDKDFDITFNVATVIEGGAIVGFAHGISSDTGGNVGETYVIAKLLKDGVQLDSAQDATLGGGATQADHTGALQLTIPKTHFPIGSVLRLTIEVWARRTSGSGNTKVGIGIDPEGRDDPAGTGAPNFGVLATGVSTKLTCAIPFNPNN